MKIDRFGRLMQDKYVGVVSPLLQSFLRVSIFCSLALSIYSFSIPDAASQTSEPGAPKYEWQSYEERHSFQGKFTYALDEFTWAYSREFARRFGMPEKWIDPNIKNGLLAVAWRMTTGSKFQLCGLSGRAENCFTTLQCQMDIYLDTSALKIEWTRPDLGRDNLSLNNESADILRERGRPDRSRHRYGVGLGMGAVTIPIDKPVALGIPNAFRYGDKLQFGGYIGKLAAYDHSTFSDIALLSYRDTGKGLCPLEARFNGGQFQAFDIAESKQPVPPNIRTIAYSLHIPESFYARIRPIYDVMNKPNEDVMNNLLKNFIQQRERSTEIEIRQPVK